MDAVPCEILDWKILAAFRSDLDATSPDCSSPVIDYIDYGEADLSNIHPSICDLELLNNLGELKREADVSPFGNYSDSIMTDRSTSGFISGASDADSDRDDSSVQLDDSAELPGLIYYHDENHNYPAITHMFGSEPSTVDNRLPSFDILADSFQRSSASSRFDSDVEESEQVVRPGKRGAKNVLLWKFLLQELSEESDSKSICWVSKNEGTFKFMDTVEISRKWGKKKNKEDMNFEKLSRGIRHYYRNKFMTRIEGCRLMYKFNWNKVPRAWRPRGLGNR